MKYLKAFVLVGIVLIIGVYVFNSNKTVGLQKNLNSDETQITQSEINKDGKPNITQNNIPRDIHIAQVKTTEAAEFALVQRSSMNVFIPNLPPDFSTNFAGILNWNGRNLQWEKVVQVEDVNPEISSKNNPVSLRFEGAVGTDQVPYLTVVDQNGAGSGEGIAKVLRPKTIDWENWEVVECYYYSDGEKKNNLLLTKPECKAVKVFLVNKDATKIAE